MLASSNHHLQSKTYRKEQDFFICFVCALNTVIKYWSIIRITQKMPISPRYQLSVGMLCILSLKGAHILYLLVH